MENKFQTTSTSAKNVKSVLITWVIFAAAAFLGLIASLKAFIFFEALLLVSFGMMLLIVSRTKWLLDFDGTLLTITNLANKQQYYFDDLKHSDFVFTQNNAQKSKNCAHLKIVGSSAVFNDVQDFEALKSYIDRVFCE